MTIAGTSDKFAYSIKFAADKLKAILNVTATPERGQPRLWRRSADG